MMEENFFQKVYDVTRRIPYGRVTSYGAIAEWIGTTGSARMVGWALNKCNLQFPPVPAHRVVNRNGLLTGNMHFANAQTMQELLEAEGIKIENNTVVNFETLFWKPR
jgi:methylated-DNA-protein-cysteine methyltransferase-like protein